MNKILLIVFFYSSLLSLKAQDYLISNGGKIESVDITTCAKKKVCDYTKQLGYGGFQDLAYTPDGKLYGVTVIGGLYEINLKNCSLIPIGGFTNFCTSMVSDNNGLLYAGSSNLMTFDPKTKIGKNLGDFPNGWLSAGDFTFRKGKLYMMTNLQELIEINIKDPSQSKLVFISKNNLGAPFGMFTIPVSCDSAVTYCVFNNGKVGILNFQQETIDSVCNIGFKATGATCALEFAGSDCSLTIDLDFNNSSGAFLNDFKDANSCITLNRAICDTSDITVGSFNKIDSITIQLINPLDGVDEYLNGLSNNDIFINTVGTHKLILINKGSAKAVNFANLIKTISYNNKAVQASPGVRIINFLVYSKGDTSKLATAYLELIPGLSAGKDITLYVCEKDSPIKLSNYIIGSPGGIWIPGNGIYDPKIGTDIKYKYIVQSPQCGPDTAIVIIKLVKMPAYNLDSIIISCDSSPVNLAVLYTTENNVIWQDGTKGNEYLAQKSGYYWFKADNGYGCVLQDTSLIILTKEHKYLNEYIVPANQNSITLNNITFTKDTFFCNALSIKTTLGCDSSYCVKIRFSDVQSVMTVNLCKGESYYYKGKYLNTTGTYIDTLKTVNDKDSLSILNLTVNELPDLIISGPDYVCTGQQIELKAISSKNVVYNWQDGSSNSIYMVISPALYDITITDQNGCSAISSKEIKASSSPDFSYAYKDINCTSFNNGLIKAKDIIGGAQPILFELSLNGQIITDLEHLTKGDYILKAIDAHGCIKEKEITIKELPLPVIDLGTDLYINEGDSLWLTAGPVYNSSSTYEWIPQDLIKDQTQNQAKFIVNESTIITAKLTDINGCVATDDINILVKKKLKVYFPNSFSPDYDGINDMFTAYANAANWQVKELSIYDRWGEQVYSQKNFPPSDPQYGWSGKYHDKYVNTGVYVYYAIMKSVSGEEYEMKGDVNLIR